MKDYIKINKVGSIIIEKKYDLNCNSKELMSNLEKYYYLKKRIRFSAKHNGFIVKRNFSHFIFNITDKSEVILNCKYNENNNHTELLLNCHIVNLLFFIILFILLNIFLLLVKIKEIDIEKIYSIAFVLILLFMINLIFKYNSCIKVIKELEKKINDKCIE